MIIMKKTKTLDETYTETINRVTEIAESEDWSVNTIVFDDTIAITFQKYSSAGQDFSFEISCYKTDEIYEILEAIHEYWNNFDISYEAYLWLDNEGHGKNGAPYEMIDVYNDMKECEESVYKLWRAIKDEL